MARYERVGGEINERSGTTWTRAELKEVLSLHQSPDGGKIHESNPAIQSLAKKLGRTTRSVEAQLLVFRGIEGGKGYAHGNKICYELWDELVNSKVKESVMNGNKNKNSEQQKGQLESRCKNPYVEQLLSYSADRDYAIANPNQWENPPPLMVETPLVDQMKELADEIWDCRGAPIWLFLVGGPGNGKSEAVGAFVRRINNLASNNGNPIPLSCSKGSDGTSSLPYWFLAEVNNRNLILLQDISIPKLEGSVPEKDFLDILSRAREELSHLIVCANRGMLLRARKLAQLNPEYTSFVSLLGQIDVRSDESSLAVTSSTDYGLDGIPVSLRVWPLDHESVLFGSVVTNPWSCASNSLLDHVLQKATSDANWEKLSCDDCEVKELCPFLADVEWLRDETRRLSFLKLLRHAEILSGQRLVLREAMALISLIIVGCPADFGRQHPCEWVQERAANCDPTCSKNLESLLELVSHLIYQDLFGRFSPTGLTLDPIQDSVDFWVLTELRKMGPQGNEVAGAIRNVDKNSAKQAGPLRLVGASGTLGELDPAKDTAWCSRVKIEVDTTLSELQSQCITMQHLVEQKLGSFFASLEDQVMSLEPHHDMAKIIAAVYRWASTLYLRSAGTALGEWVHSPVIDQYLDFMKSAAGHVNIPDKSITLRDLVQKSSEGDKDTKDKYEVAPRTFIQLPDPDLSFEPARDRSTSPRWPANDRLTLKVTALQGKTTNYAFLTGRIFLDMWRKVGMGVANWSVPPSLDELMSTWIEDYVISNKVFLGSSLVKLESDVASLNFEFYDHKIQISRELP